MTFPFDEQRIKRYGGLATRYHNTDVNCCAGPTDAVVRFQSTSLESVSQAVGLVNLKAV